MIKLLLQNCTVCLSCFGRQLVFKILEYLLYVARHRHKRPGPIWIQTVQICCGVWICLSVSSLIRIYWHVGCVTLRRIQVYYQKNIVNCLVVMVTINDICWMCESTVFTSFRLHCSSYFHVTLYRYQSTKDNMQSTRAVSLGLIFFELFPLELCQTQKWHLRVCHQTNFSNMSEKKG